MKRASIIILTAAAALFAASCTADKKMTVDSGRKIGFDFRICGETDTLSARTKSVTRVYELQGDHLDKKLFMYSTVGDFSDDGTLTRGTPVNDMSQFYDSFGVMAYKYQGSWEETSCIPNYMHDIEVTESSGWKTDFHWPGKGCNMRFFAYAPYHQYHGEDLTLTLSSATDPGTPKITYTVPATSEGQPDLLYAVGEEVTGDDYRPVSLLFRHSLTGVRFVTSDFIEGEITKIVLKNVHGTGSYRLGDGAWNDLSGIGAFECAVNRTVGTDEDVVAGDATFMMIPQTLPAEAEIDIVYVDDEGNPQTFTAGMGGSEWPAGKIVTYRVSRVRINLADEIDLNVDDELDLRADDGFEILPESAADEALEWSSSNEDVATVDADGKVTALSEGTADITVKMVNYPATTATCRINVISICISPDGLKTKEGIPCPILVLDLNGDPHTLVPVIKPEEFASEELDWSSSEEEENVAEVNDNGEVTPKNPGKSEISVCMPEHENINEGVCIVYVLDLDITGELFLPTGGDPYNLAGDAGFKHDPAELDGETLALDWSSSDEEETVVTVDDDGKVTPVGPGNAVITVKYSDDLFSDITATCEVHVISITLPEEVNLAAGGSDTQLNPAIQPEGVFHDGDLEWSSSDGNVAEVNDNGEVTPKNPGTATITVEYSDNPDITASCTVNVIRLTLSEDEINLAMGGSTQLTSTIQPEGVFNGEDLDWSSSNETVATVNDNGEVTPVGPGDAVITVKIRNTDIEATCTVHVISITLPEVVNLAVDGDGTQLTPTIQPEGVFEGGDLDWSSSDEAVVTVDDNGNVTPVGTGTATITVKYSDNPDITATCTVNVISLTLSENGISLAMGESTQLTSTIQPDGLFDGEDLDWSSSNETVAKVNENGEVTPVGTGDAVITVKIRDTDIKATCTVTVTSPTPLTFTVGEGENAVTFEMMPVEAGTFLMSAQPDDPNGPNYYEDLMSGQGYLHEVTLTKNYWMGKYEVTQGLWEAVMGDDNWPETPPGALGEGDDYPVYWISWDDICKTDGFLAKLNAALSSELDEMGMEFVLPTEAQWEFAAGGGNAGHNTDGSCKHIYSGSNNIDLVAWYNSNSKVFVSDDFLTEQAHPVGQMQPNELGIYDMSGNVFEWCSDWYRMYTPGSETDPTGPSDGTQRINRGGCCGTTWHTCHVWFRLPVEPDDRGRYNPADRSWCFGFRLALITTTTTP